MLKTKYKRITNDEREEISRFLAAGKSQAEIAMALDRHPATISREIKRNRGKSGYRAFSASKRSMNTAASRRKGKSRLEKDKTMSYLVVFALDDPDRSHEILDAWEGVGVKGITILESTGLGRVRRGGIRDDLPLMPSLIELYKITESHNRTMFSVVDDLDVAHTLVDSAQNIVGDMEQPNSGLIFIAPLVEVYGLNKENRQ